jgi:heptosyltransferase-2
MYQTGCRYFSGYKPCEKNSQCDEGCPARDVPRLSILLVHLGAMGAVLRATALLPMIKRKFPSSKITWITETPELLRYNPYVDFAFNTSESDLNKLPAFNFDIALVVDKSIQASAILKRAHVDMVYGFLANSQTGAIEPATTAAYELWDLGLDNDKKFFENSKTELQLQAEALELVYNRDPYGVFLSQVEKTESAQRKILWSVFGKKTIVGINTGCGPLLPEKKFPLTKWCQVFEKISLNDNLLQKISLVLLGGPAEQHDHEQLKNNFPFLQFSPLTNGLRDGLVSADACDLLITGDSLGMHMGIGLKKYVIAWFGPSCAQEIDLYDRGEKILAATMPCSPCWKRTCNKDYKCNDSIEADSILSALARGLDFKEQVPPILDSERIQLNKFRGVNENEELYHAPHEFMNLMAEMIL